MRDKALWDWVKPPGWDRDLWCGCLAGLAVGLLALGGVVGWMEQNTPSIENLQNRVEVGVNSLGMRFVWIRVQGPKLIYMGAREVSAENYCLFLRHGPEDLAPGRHHDLTLGAKPAEESELQRIRELSQPGQGGVPVRRVNYWHAQRFAEWLTVRERRQGQLGPGDRYRLPRDEEWSVAAGMQESQDPNPFDRGYASAEKYDNATKSPQPLAGIQGLGEDPVEWCENQRGSERIVRGFSPGRPWERAKLAPGDSDSRMGFRLVLEKGGKTR